MSREVTEHEGYLVQVNSDHRITVLTSGNWSACAFVGFSIRDDGYSSALGYVGTDPVHLLEHAQYDEVARTANNNWRVVQSGQGEIVGLLDLIERLTAPSDKAVG